MYDSSGEKKLQYKAVFTITELPQTKWIALSRHPSVTETRLNGTLLEQPLEGMAYQTLPCVPASLLRVGRNELTGVIRHNVKASKDKNGKRYFKPAKITASWKSTAIQ